MYNDTESETTNVVNLKVKPKITKQPVTTTVVLGKKASFSVEALGKELKFQWQYRKSSSGSWENISATSGKTANYSLTTGERHNGYQYRCRVTSLGAASYSSIATLKVKPKIVTQPVSQTVSVGTKASFTVEAQGKELKYQWQFRKSASGSWSNISAASGKTATYTLTVEDRHNGYQYRCKVTSLSVYSYTSVVTLKVKPKITTQPQPVSVKAGKKATFTVAAAGENLTYQWQYKKPDGSWTNVTAASGKTASYSFTTAARHNGYQYRCKVTNSGGTVTSKAVTLTVL